MNWKHALSDYTHYLRLERGLSDNSVQNYGRDLAKIPPIPEAVLHVIIQEKKHS